MRTASGYFALFVTFLTTASNCQLSTGTGIAANPPSVISSNVPVPVTPKWSPQEVSLLFSGSEASDRIILTLNNNHVTPLKVQATVYTALGNPTVLPAFDLIGKESKLVELRNLLQEAGLAHQELGWMKLEYKGVFLGLGAQLTLYSSHDGTGVDSPRSLATDFKTKERHAAFWMPQEAIATIALTNTSTDAISVRVICGSFRDDVLVRPNATAVKRIVRSEMNSPFDTVRTASSCDLISGGANSALRVSGAVADPRGYDAPIRFYDSTTATSTSLTSVGVSTSAESHIVVHNLSDSAVSFEPIIAEATLNEPRKLKLMPNVVGPHMDIEVSIDTALRGLKVLGISNATVTLKSSAPKGSFVGSLTQISNPDRLVEDIPLRTGNIAANAMGAYPLRWDEDYTNLVTVTNTSDKLLAAHAFITYGNLVYVLPTHPVQPGQTAVYDVDELRRSQTKDVNGIVLPFDTIYGKFFWYEGGQGKNIGLLGRNSVTSIRNRRKSSFSCGGQCDQSSSQWPFFSVTPDNHYAPHNGSWESTVSTLYTDSYGNYYSTPLNFSDTDFTIADTSIISFQANPETATSYIATAGLPGQTIYSLTWNWFFSTYDEAENCHVVENTNVMQGFTGTQPSIKYTGQSAVINDTTQSVIVGQQINLTASFSLPSGVSIVSQSWTVPGSTVGGYVANTNSGSPTIADFTNQSTTFYWVDSATARQVKFTVTLSDYSTLTASVTFDVKGPTSPQMAATLNPGGVTVENNVLFFGNNTTTAGIIFTPSVTQPAGISGTFTYVQLILTTTTDVITSTTVTGLCTLGRGLDNYYPYVVNSSGIASDSPAIGLHSTYLEVQRYFSATMYLMWNSGLTNSIPIPLGSLTWQFMGDAYRSATNVPWSLRNPGATADAFAPSSTYPQWTTHVVNGQLSCDVIP